MLAAKREQLLDHQHVAAASVRAHLEHGGHVRCERGMQHRLENLHRRIVLASAVEKQKAETEAEKVQHRIVRELLCLRLGRRRGWGCRVAVVSVSVRTLRRHRGVLLSRRSLDDRRRLRHQRRDDRLRTLLIARGHEHHAKREGGICLHLERLFRACAVVSVTLPRNDGREEAGNLLLAASGVCDAKTKHRRSAHVKVLRAIDAVVQQGVRRVALVAHVGVNHSHGEKRAGDDVRLGAVQVLVNLRQATLDVPHEEHANAPRGGRLAVLLVLVDPLHLRRGGICSLGFAVFATTRRGCGQHELVLAESCVHERIHVRCRKILLRGVRRGAPARASASTLHEVALVHVLRRLGLHHVKVARERQVVLAQPRVRDGTLKRLAQRLRAVTAILEAHGSRPILEVEPVSVTSEKVAQLLPLHGILRVHERRHDVVAGVALQRDAHRILVLAALPVDGVRRGERDVVVGFAEVRRDGQQVKPGAFAVLAVDVPWQRGELVHLDEQVDGVWLCVVQDVERHDEAHEVHEFVVRRGRRTRGRIDGLDGFHLASVELRPDFTRQVLDIFVSPVSNPSVRAVCRGLRDGRSLEPVREALVFVLGSKRHGENGDDIREQESVGLVFGPRAVRLLERVEVRPEELERFRHGRHAGGGFSDLLPHRLDGKFLHPRFVVGFRESRHA
mmetsp:Transcript_10175/g.27290  ORF Transcript_10175/g.27290 Transcript_10175/m.27290 type:complete len:674 (-) Transcript_10175:155-2176(-)